MGRINKNVPGSAKQNGEQWFRIDPVERSFEGPLTLEDLKRGMAEQAYYWSDFALCPARGFAWKRLLEIPELIAMCPEKPDERTLQYFSQIAFKQNEYKKTSLEVPSTFEVTRAGQPAPKKETSIQKARNLVPEKTALQVLKVAVPRVSAASPVVRSDSDERPPPSTSREAEWYLLIDDQECGPFSILEIGEAAKKGKRPDRAFVWKEGMKRWMPIVALKVFSHLKLGGWGADFLELNEETDQDLVENFQNKRRSFRRSIAASVMRLSENGIRQMIGVCGDLSAEGFLLEQDIQRVDYKVGSRHLVEIRPVSKSILKPFQAQVEVRWVDHENFSIGFQFVKLHPIDQKLLIRYLESLERRPQ